MSVEVRTQGLLFLWAAAAGLALGILYDLGRVLRREHPGMTAPADGLFLLGCLAVLAGTVLYTRGLRLYQLGGMFLGAGAWNLTFSGGFLSLSRRALRGVEGLFSRALRGARKTAHFLKKTAKKIFPSGGKWSTIKTVPRFPGRRRAGGRPR